MRITWLVVVSLIALQAPALGSEWTTLTHPEPPFTISYPADWKKLRADNDGLTLVAPHVRGLGIIVTGTTTTSGATIAELESKLPRAIADKFSGYQPLRTDRLMLAGWPGIVHYFTANREGVRAYAMVAAVRTDTHGFMLFGMTLLDSPRLQEEVTLLQQIIMGFRPGS